MRSCLREFLSLTLHNLTQTPAPFRHYCSATCQKEDWKTHKYYCDGNLLSSWSGSDLTQSKLMTALEKWLKLHMGTVWEYLLWVFGSYDDPKAHQGAALWILTFYDPNATNMETRFTPIKLDVMTVDAMKRENKPVYSNAVRLLKESNASCPEEETFGKGLIVVCCMDPDAVANVAFSMVPEWQQLPKVKPCEFEGVEDMLSALLKDLKHV